MIYGTIKIGCIFSLFSQNHCVGFTLHQIWDKVFAGVCPQGGWLNSMQQRSHDQHQWGSASNGICLWEVCIQRGLHRGGLHPERFGQNPYPQSELEKRTVRILLGCFLVQDIFSSVKKRKSL